MKDFFTKIGPLILRETLWLFGALVGAMLLSAGVHWLLQANDNIYLQLLAELPADAGFHLKVLLFGLCFLGVYIVRISVAAVDSLVAA